METSSVILGILLFVGVILIAVAVFAKNPASATPQPPTPPGICPKTCNPDNSFPCAKWKVGNGVKSAYIPCSTNGTPDSTQVNVTNDCCAVTCEDGYFNNGSNCVPIGTKPECINYTPSVGNYGYICKLQSDGTYKPYEVDGVTPTPSNVDLAGNLICGASGLVPPKTCDPSNLPTQLTRFCSVNGYWNSKTQYDDFVCPEGNCNEKNATGYSCDQSKSVCTLGVEYPCDPKETSNACLTNYLQSNSDYSSCVQNATRKCIKGPDGNPVLDKCIPSVCKPGYYPTPQTDLSGNVQCWASGYLGYCSPVDYTQPNGNGIGDNNCLKDALGNQSAVPTIIDTCAVDAMWGGNKTYGCFCKPSNNQYWQGNTSIYMCDPGNSSSCFGGNSSGKADYVNPSYTGAVDANGASRFLPMEVLTNVTDRNMNPCSF